MPRVHECTGVASLGGCPRIEAVARGRYFRPIFRAFEANSRSYLTRMGEKLGGNIFSAVGSLFSDSLLGTLNLARSGDTHAQNQLDQLLLDGEFSNIETMT